MKEIPSIEPPEPKPKKSVGKHSLMLSDISADSKRATAKFADVLGSSSAKNNSRKSISKAKVLIGFDSKKVNEYPTFIEEGQVIVNQKDKIES